MSGWMLSCPNCGTSNEVLQDAVRIRCGVVFYRCVCTNCSQEFEGRQEYWRWMGLVEGPPDEMEPEPS